MQKQQDIKVRLKFKHVINVKLNTLNRVEVIILYKAEGIGRVEKDGGILQVNLVDTINGLSQILNSIFLMPNIECQIGLLVIVK